MMRFVLLIILAYVAGSVNFSILLFRFLGLQDPRSRFSGNPGTYYIYFGCVDIDGVIHYNAYELIAR